MNGKKDEYMLNKNVVIAFMGIWDTVGSLGVPKTTLESWIQKTGISYNFNESYGYHDTSLPTPLGKPSLKETRSNPYLHKCYCRCFTVGNDNWRAVIVRAYQALSLDEERISFGPTLLRLPRWKDEQKQMGNDTGLYQCWFPGVHTDVGGGYERAYRDLSDISLAWMIDCIGSQLSFRDDLAEMLKTTTLDPGRNKSDELPKDIGWGLSKKHNEMEKGWFKLAGGETRTPGEYYLDKIYDEEKLTFQTNESVHQSARLRWKKDPNWRPKALNGFEIVAPDLSKGEWAYKWVKKDKKGKVILELPEAETGWGDLSQSMLRKEDRDFFKLDEVPVENQ